MSKRSLVDKVKLTSVEDMFGLTDEPTMGQIVPNLDGQVVDVPLSELHTFKNHPFRVVDDEKMEETVASIKEYGVLAPGIARPRPEGGYEILSGHRRRRACEIAGFETMQMLIKDVTDDEAVEIMVDANIQREDILPSEKAKAYLMKFEAMKHQGKNANGKRTTEEIGEVAGESGKTVQRYIQLARLSDDMLKLVDEKRVGFGQGVDISFLDDKAQGWVYETLTETKCGISGVQSAVIKSRFKDGTLTADQVWEILNQVKIKPRKIVFNSNKLDAYFTPDYSTEKIEELIIKLLDEWKENGGIVDGEA